MWTAQTFGPGNFSKYWLLGTCILNNEGLRERWWLFQIVLWIISEISLALILQWCLSPTTGGKEPYKQRRGNQPKCGIKKKEFWQICLGEHRLQHSKISENSFARRAKKSGMAQECVCGKGPNAFAASHAGPVDGHGLHLPFPQRVGSGVW